MRTCYFHDSTSSLTFPEQPATMPRYTLPTTGFTLCSSTSSPFPMIRLDVLWRTPATSAPTRYLAANFAPATREHRYCTCHPAFLKSYITKLSPYCIGSMSHEIHFPTRLGAPPHPPRFRVSRTALKSGNLCQQANYAPPLVSWLDFLGTKKTRLPRSLT